MSPVSKELEIDARWVYLRSFLLAFVVCQIAVWHHLQRMPGRRPGHRLMLFFLAPKPTIRSFGLALLAGGVVTVLAIVLVRLVVRPLLKLWFSPSVDTACGLFHLAADEKIIASVSARRQSGWAWHPGCLTVTTRRLWFFPSRWNQEPWSTLLADVDRIAPESSVLAELPPIRNWPLPLRLSSRSAGGAVFAVADPAAVLAWLSASARQGRPGPDPLGRRRGWNQELLMSKRFTVLIADFLDETSIESAVLVGLADLIMARARDETELSKYLPDTDAIMVFHDLSILGEPSFALAPRCRGVVRAGVGYNNIDVNAATRHGVVVCNVPDYGTEEVADHAIMFLLALSRRLFDSHQAIRAGTWDYRTALGAPRLRGKTFGIIGCGRIGTATAVRAKALGLDVVFYDPFLRQGMDKALGIRRVYCLEELLEQSHFVSLHCYLPTGRLAISMNAAGRIARMRPGAFLINTARGPLVDEAALLGALDSGQIAAAGLDVVESEPLENDRLRLHPHALFTPHTAFYSVEGYTELRTKTAEEVRRILLGEPPRNPVNVIASTAPRP